METADEEDDWQWTRVATPGELARKHYLASERWYGVLIREVAQEASKLPDEETRADAAEEGFDVVEAIGWAVNENWWGRYDEEAGEKSRLPWHHKSQVILAPKQRLQPYILRSYVEDAAASYLKLPMRVDSLDRILVDMLIAAEMFGFADEIQPFLRRWFPLPLRWIVNNVITFIVGVGLAVGLFMWFPNSNLAQGLGWAILGLTILGNLWSLLAFPFAYPGIRRNEKKVRAIVTSMVDAYEPLAGSPTSVRFLHERVLKAADVGVVWPAALIVLLEDIQARRNSI